LESVQGYETVVVDHGSTDGTQKVVADRFPRVTLVCQENRGLAAGWNRGMLELGSRRFYLFLNADAWMVGDAVGKLVAFADSHPHAAVVGPRLLNEDGTTQRSVRGFPSTWRLATQYLILHRLAPSSRVFNAAAEARFDYNATAEVDWVIGAAMLVRNAAITQIGQLDERFFLFSEEVDWCYRFKAAGWKIVYFPDAEAIHVGEASHGGLMVREYVRSNLRYIAKHHGQDAAERARRVMLIGVTIRGLLHRGLKRRANREAAHWLASGSAEELLTRPREGE
jgi:N-acetylglucosaminyl-diphospho-decaprenol L-rhamnosyltransferase